MKTGINHIITKSLLALGFFGMFTIPASAAYFDNAPAPYCDVRITRTLQTGSEGVEVTVLQHFLNRTGDLSATPNGHFGPATKASVRLFQHDNYINPTGVVGPMTRNAINERMCDTNLQIDTFDTYSYYDTTVYSYASGVTYVDPFDPYVQVITPANTTPNVYTNPQGAVQTTQYNTNYSTVPVNTVSPIVSNPVATQTAPVTSPVSGTRVIYSPSIGYTYGITPASGSLTITTPRANASYNEGDTVQLVWTTSNLTMVGGYTILLENNTTNQSKAVTTTSSNSASFVLTKELLDAVCSGACNNSQQGSYRVVVTTPVRDITGNVSTLRAAVAPVTIKRPIANFGTVSITTSKTPVNSGEIFKLYVNIPTGASWNANVYSQYAFKIRAVCPTGVTVSIAGTPCGQDFSIPFAPSYFQSEIPVALSNATWYQQNVTFILTATTLQGQVLGTSQVNVTANHTPFNW